MKFTIGVKKDVGGGYIKQFTVSDIPVNGCSPVMEMDLSNYTANEPYIVEIVSASWDYSCTEATEMGHSQADQFCPYSNVYSNYCFEVSLQVATDFTKISSKHFSNFHSEVLFVSLRDLVEKSRTSCVRLRDFSVQNIKGNPWHFYVY